ncbi:hypothetical protein AHAS_Ahas11G0025600 [Arachis hypogaea]
MARKKVEFKYIANDSKRKATQKKRKSGLTKKVDEISTLCGVDACAIIYTPDEPRPEVWPSPLEVNRVISRFKEMPELDQSKKMMSQESFLRQRIQKGQDQLKKLKNENRKKEMNNLMFQSLGGYQSLDNATMIDLNDLAWIIDQNIKEVNKQISKLQGQEGTSSNNNRVATINEEQAQVDNIINDELAELSNGVRYTLSSASPSFFLTSSLPKATTTTINNISVTRFPPLNLQKAATSFNNNNISQSPQNYNNDNNIIFLAEAPTTTSSSLFLSSNTMSALLPQFLSLKYDNGLALFQCHLAHPLLLF